MNATEIKIELFRKLDSLDVKNLKEVYGLLLNYINTKNDYAEWNQLSDIQKNAIQIGLKQLDKGQGIAHKDIMKKYRNKYSNV